MGNFLLTLGLVLAGGTGSVMLGGFAFLAWGEWDYRRRQRAMTARRQRAVDSLREKQ